RREVHGRIARALTSDFPEVGDRNPELVAHHWSLAAEHEQAADAWQTAGLLAISHSHVSAGVGYLERAVEELRSLPDAGAHSEQEARLLTLIGLGRVTTKGAAAPETGQVFARARELTLGSRSASAGHALVGLSTYEFGNGRCEKASVLAAELEAL